LTRLHVIPGNLDLLLHLHHLADGDSGILRGRRGAFGRRRPAPAAPSTPAAATSAAATSAAALARLGRGRQDDQRAHGQQPLPESQPGCHGSPPYVVAQRCFVESVIPTPGRVELGADCTICAEWIPGNEYNQGTQQSIAENGKNWQAG